MSKGKQVKPATCLYSYQEPPSTHVNFHLHHETVCFSLAWFWLLPRSSSPHALTTSTQLRWGCTVHRLGSIFSHNNFKSLRNSDIGSHVCGQRKEDRLTALFWLSNHLRQKRQLNAQAVASEAKLWRNVKHSCDDDTDVVERSLKRLKPKCKQDIQYFCIQYFCTSRRGRS